MPQLWFNGTPEWFRVTKWNRTAVAFADRHYSRQTVGAGQCMPPGETLVMLEGGATAMWGAVHNFDPAQDDTKRWRVSIFRNEGGRRSSELILVATPMTLAYWLRKYGHMPSVPLSTEVDPTKTRRKRDPGRCFRRAGWELWSRGGGQRPLRVPCARRARSARDSRAGAEVSGRVLRAPFPWYGGKFYAAPLIWRAFGNVPNYVEPFAGSIATLLARPHAPKVETINDKDGFVANFWRAAKAAPDEVARWCDWPVNEADLHARHRWLVSRGKSVFDQLVADPEWFDARVAGWWCWGVCTWIGNGWCHVDERVANQKRRPKLNNTNGNGALAIANNSRPDLSAPHGRGIVSLHRTMPRVASPGHGIHAPSRKRPQTSRSKGIHRSGVVGSDGVVEVMHAISERLRYVRVCCGDWKRVIGRSTLGIDTAHGMTPCGILFDPPYDHDLRDKRLYREDDRGVSDEVREWAIANGDNPALRIALCGQEGEHEMPRSWTKVAWASTSSAKFRAAERIWFSPHCQASAAQGDLFEEATHAGH